MSKRVRVPGHTRRWPRGRGELQRYAVFVPDRGFVTKRMEIATKPGANCLFTLGEATEAMDSLSGLKPTLWKRL